MNNKKFTDKKSAEAFLKETEKPFKLKIVCAIVAVAVLVLMILVDSVWHPALTAFELLYIVGGIGALLASAAFLRLLKFSMKLFKWGWLLTPFWLFDIVIATALGGTVFLIGLVVPVVPVTIEALLLYMNRKKAELFLKFGE